MAQTTPSITNVSNITADSSASPQSPAKQVAQYGTWSSPVSVKQVSTALRLNDVQWDSDGKTLVWHEGRGAQGVLVAQTGIDAPRDLTDELSVRGRVGYGGGEFTLHSGWVYFTANGRLYKQALTGGNARPITPNFGAAAAPRVSPDGKWVAFIHSDEGVDGLAIVDSDGKQWSRKLLYGTDFAMQPAWHPDNHRLAYIAWDHPNMPWDGTELRLLTLDDHATLVNQTVIAGDQQTAIFQPEFSPDGRYLSYISDQTGWAQLYHYDLVAGTHTQITTAHGDHGEPAWIQGLRMYGWLGDSSGLIYTLNQGGFASVWRYTFADKTHTRLDDLNPYTSFDQLSVSPVDGTLAAVVSSSRRTARVISYHPVQGERIYRRATPEKISTTALSEAQPLTWTGHDNEPVHGLYYPPTSEKYAGAGTPPLIVYVHGGPTSQAVANWNSEVQFFATRGFAVLAVNHRGSTGYGRDYMRKLDHNWGYYDVEDSVSGALYLAGLGLADKQKLVIMGGSAGGFTTLQALVDKPGIFKAGVCKYGISNQFMLVQDTHKFESHYSYTLLGDLPEAAANFRRRSPIYAVENLCDSIIIFQGDEDTVVPRNQSDLIVESLKARSVPHEYYVFAGEGHGFRKSENLETMYTATLKFLEQHVIYV